MTTRARTSKTQSAHTSQTHSPETTTGSCHRMVSRSMWMMGLSTWAGRLSVTRGMKTATKMTELAFNVAGAGIALLFAIGSVGLLLLHTWLKSLERNEHENEDD